MFKKTLLLFTKEPGKEGVSWLELSLWIGSAVAAVTLLVLTHLEFYRVPLLGEPRKVDLTFSYLYGMFVAFFTIVKEGRRWTLADFESTRIGHYFTILWGLAAFEMAVVGHVTDFVFPTSVIVINVGVWSIAVGAKISWFVHRAKHHEEYEEKAEKARKKKGD